MRVLAAAAFGVLTLGAALTSGPWGRAYAQGFGSGFATGYAAGENDGRLQQQLEDESHALGDPAHWQSDPSDRATRNWGGSDFPDNGGLSDHADDGDMGNEP